MVLCFQESRPLICDKSVSGEPCLGHVALYQYTDPLTSFPGQDGAWERGYWRSTEDCGYVAGIQVVTLLPSTHTPHTHTYTPYHTQAKAQQSGGSESAAIVNLAKALEEGSLDQDPFIQQYRAKRLEEMKHQAKLGAQRLVGGERE